SRGHHGAGIYHPGADDHVFRRPERAGSRHRGWIRLPRAREYQTAPGRDRHVAARVRGEIVSVTGCRPDSSVSHGDRVSRGFFLHPQGICETDHVGDGTRVWAFAHVLPGARIGRDCNICDHVFIENDVIVGDRVTVKCGVQLWDGVRLENDVFVGPNATFTNDPFPRSRHRPETFATTIVRQGASIGPNAVLLPGVTIGR